MKKATHIYFIAILGFGILITWIYFSPATELLLTNNTQYIISGGSDSLTLPRQAKILETTSVTALLKAAIFTPLNNTPEGNHLLFGWMERALLLSGAKLFSIEQAHNFLIHILLLLNVLIFYSLGRALGWPKEVALALAFTFTLTPLARARAAIHPMYLAFFPIASFWLAIEIIKKMGTQNKAVIKSTILIFLVALSPQYTQLTIFFISPLLLLYLFLDHEKSIKEKLIALTLASFPAILLTFYSYIGAKNIPHSALSSLAPADLGDQFWKLFSASPIQYLGGDVYSAWDWNFLRKKLQIIDLSFAHEKAHGIRWSLLAIFLFSLKEMKWKENTLFLSVILFSFWCSLGPDYFSPAGILRWIFPEFRVANRFSPIVHFALLLYVGTYLSMKWKESMNGWRTALLLVVMLEIIPSNQLPVVKMLPLPEHLPKKDCGTLMALPYFSATRDSFSFNKLNLILANSDCAIANRSNYEDFPPSFIENLSASNLQCLGVRWIFNYSGDKSMCKKFNAITRNDFLCELPAAAASSSFASCLHEKK